MQIDSGAVDTVAPRHVARAFKLCETKASTNKSKIDNFGERKVSGYTEDGTMILLRMTCADVRKVLGSVHRMNKGGNIVVLDGPSSYKQNKRTGQKNKIRYENGQYVVYMWVPSGPKEAEKEAEKEAANRLKGNRFAILAADEEPGFTRQVRGR